jgi:hypothetical protein
VHVDLTDESLILKITNNKFLINKTYPNSESVASIEDNNTIKFIINQFKNQSS